MVLEEDVQLAIIIEQKVVPDRCWISGFWAK